MVDLSKSHHMHLNTSCARNYWTSTENLQFSEAKKIPQPISCSSSGFLDRKFGTKDFPWWGFWNPLTNTCRDSLNSVPSSEQVSPVDSC